jgi:UDP-GlcNAc:undecaprenyl-phosphate/decaprenyl-phosphate GlcNAc-1-phosphate transferase
MAGLLPAAVGVGVAAVATWAARRTLQRRPPGGPERWQRTNHAGRTVSLLEGPAYVVGATAGLLVTPGVPTATRAAAVMATLGAGAFGAYDDLAGTTSSKGLRGHLGALRRGEVTSGLIKIVGIGVMGLGAAWLVSDGVVDALVGGALVAGSANLVNLFDLRPGRALKVGLLSAPLLLTGGGAVAAAPLGAAAASLPEDLGERGMLGDTGANALGAGVGLALVTVTGTVGAAGCLAAVVALTLASEKVSFSKVIDSTAPLRWADRLGRRPHPSDTRGTP